ncbi:hypothetical protein [Sphingomonas sp. Root710]|uniref:hypothetical protein n=1 Tax=Sphingomonas sp. Root710 TaxID=1736594 RepID=UPI0012E33055|nr:hypothetical protein [Sphingomonas sp. Root710]
MLEGDNDADRKRLRCDREQRTGGAFEVLHDMLLSNGTFSLRTICLCGAAEIDAING